MLSLVKNTLVLQTHSSEIKCLEITNLEFKKILQNSENRDSTLPFSLASEEKKTEDDALYNSRVVINLVHKIITDKNLEKEDIKSKLELLYEKLFTMHDYKGALIAAMSLGDKILISKALEAQKE